MVNAKLSREIDETLGLLPENATLGDLIQALELRADIAAGIADAATGRVVPNDTVRQRFGLA